MAEYDTIFIPDSGPMRPAFGRVAKKGGKDHDKAHEGQWYFSTSIEGKYGKCFCDANSKNWNEFLRVF